MSVYIIDEGIRLIILHACGLKSAHCIKFHKLSTASACKIYVTQLGMESKRRNVTDEKLSFQLCIPIVV